MRAMEFLWLTVSQLYVGAFMLRLMLQLTRADFYNPFSQFIVRITAPLLRPLRRVLPGWRGIDTASLVIILVLQLIAMAVWVLIRGGAPEPLLLAILTVGKLIGLLLNIYFIALIGQVILSWVAQGYHPVMSVLDSLTGPILRPIRNVLPTPAGIDFSPAVALLGIMFLRYLIGDIFPMLRGLV
ncbi:YggT family protein [Alkalilimnicola sp. S0819]|uniref:YggT family protein n=1 Tax=Alkalilimnicola sp. S0819 TaxID=2613922 RepID=UPI00126229FE|nr:YggT family protein [Alkalilimnicola sp. S0819]KAB7624454.1 YggT family protein [Alkalilimnicola sp. S0819]MPQ16288.1 YggT family protein [Alkalilimnicola sp. S0819]